MTDTGLESRELRVRDLRYPKRLLSPEQDDSDLTADIRERGQIEPIVVWQGTVVDGVRRLRILRDITREKVGTKLSTGTVWAYQPATADQLLYSMKPWNYADKFGVPWANRPLDFEIVWRTISDAYRGEHVGPGVPPFRDKALAHIGVKAHVIHHLLAVSRIYRDLDPEQDPLLTTEYLRQTLQRVLRGEASPAYFIRVRRDHSMTGDITAAVLQREAVEKMLASLVGINASFRTLGPLAKDLSDEEVADWIVRLKKERSDLAVAVTLLKKGKKAK